MSTYIGSVRAQLFSVEGIYWLIGIVCSILCASIITNQSFNFFESGGVWSQAYNYYFLSLLEGKQNVPIKAIGWEGHFSDDGTAYMYYGAGPALFRALFYPFVDLTTTPVSRAVVWSLVIGTGFISQSTLLYCVRQCTFCHQEFRRATLWIGGILIWFASPVLILASSAPVYHEPIAVAYFCTILSIHLIVLLKYGSPHFGRYLIVLALLAGLALNSRPHVGIGLYVVTSLLLVWVIGHNLKPFKTKLPLWRLGPAIIRDHSYTLKVLFILALFGITFIALTLLKMGSFSLLDAEKVRFGLLYLGLESTDSLRQSGYRDDGVFNLLRVVPNLIYYSFGSQSLFDLLRDWFGLGYVRTELPAAPFTLLWLPWVLFSATGIFSYSRLLYKATSPRRVLFPPSTVIVCLSLLIIAVFILSYAEITHRYKVEIWPVIWIASILYLPKFIDLTAKYPFKSRYLLVFLIAIVTFSCAYSIAMALNYSNFFEADAMWDYHTCVKFIKNALVKVPLPLSLCN